MIKPTLLILFTLISISYLAQEPKRQIGLNLTGAVFNTFDFEEIVTGVAVSYTNQKRYVTLGTHFYNPFSKKFKLNEFDIQYRYFPNTPLRTFNLFFCLGLDHKYFDRTYRKADYFNNYTSYKERERITGLSFGFGFQVNFLKRLNFHTSISNYMFTNTVRTDRIVETTQVSSATKSTYLYLISEMILVGVTYNFDLNKKSSTN
jgi:hypothetical protein